jgi:hypothetical protein
MKKYVFLLLFFIPLILSACSQKVEDSQDYSGIIGDGRALGYEYTISKEQNVFSWQVGYKGDKYIINEAAENKDDLENFMRTVNDSKVTLAKLIISTTYLVIVAIMTFLFYRKNRKIIIEGSAIITIFTFIAVYIAIEASFDLNGSLQDAKYYYLKLTTN